MRVLVAIDGSPCSQSAVRNVSMRTWPADTAFTVVTVVTSRLPLIPDPTFVMAAAYETILNESRKEAPGLVESAASVIRTALPHASVDTRVLEGNPKTLIVDEARDWGADLIVMGAHGWNAAKRAVLGSVSHAVVLHAPCSVEITRTPQCLADAQD